ncbi:ribonucleoside-diphosphate reductase subunit alpha [Micromonospora purpureochromogenes]
MPDTDPERILALVSSGRTAGADTDELTRLAIAAAAGLTAEEPGYARLAARLLAGRIADETTGQGIDSFSDSVAAAYAEGLLDPGFAGFVATHAATLDALVDHAGDDAFEYFGLRTLHDRYLLRHPRSRAVLERPQHFWLRVATGLSDTVEQAGELYRLMSRLAYLPSSPTLFNAGARHQQLSSCFLVDSPRDELDSIYDRYTQVARLSKFAGGIGISWSRVRSRGSLIRGTNGRSNGIVPWLRTLDASVAAVNQGGRRKGAACVYLDTWHADIEEFLELKDNTGDEARRTHNLNLANWVPDEFMRRVEADADWSLFDPKEVPELVDLWGAEFDAAYRAAEAAGRAVRTLPARTLYGRMMRTLAQTGNGWMTFKDAANRTCNQVGAGGGVVHHSNLCTEILEVTSDDETAVCTLGSVNLAAHLVDGGVDFAQLATTVRLAVGALDRAIDRNWFPTEQAATAHRRWRPLGLGVMGLADVFAALRLPFDSPEALALSTRIAEEVALAAYDASADLAAERGAHPAYPLTRAAGGLDAASRAEDAARADRSARESASPATPSASPTTAGPTASPSATPTRKATPQPKPTPTRTAKPKPSWVIPMKGAEITSCYGQRWGTLHAGIDFAMPAGTPVRAAFGGTVEKAGDVGDGYGISVVVNHGNGYLTHYAHLSTAKVGVGEKVGAGETLGLEGSTGDSTGPHLHFEVHQGQMWNQIDPAPFLRARGIDVGC